MNDNRILDLHELIDVFTEDQYPANENHVSSVPFDDIFEQLTGRFAEAGFSYEVTQAGSYQDGSNYVIVKLSVPVGDTIVSRPGAADGNIGMSGLITLALRNAALRHLGMGASLYQHEPGQEPQFEPRAAVPRGAGPNRFGGAGAVPNGKVYGNNNYLNTQGATGGGPQYREWDGNVVIKSGQYQGVRWGDVPIQDLENMCNKGNFLGQKEMQRRVEQGLIPQSPFNR